jgi:hypothetical protein
MTMPVNGFLFNPAAAEAAHHDSPAWQEQISATSCRARLMAGYVARA